MTYPPQPGSGSFGPVPNSQPPGDPAYGYPGSAPGYGYPQQPSTPPGGLPPYSQPVPPADPLLVTIGDIGVSASAITTPSGTMPVKGAIWTATDMSRTDERIPPHAVALAIIFAILLCGLGLLFLLMKEKRTTGYVQVTVNSGGRFRSTMVPVNSPNAVMEVLNRVNYVRSLCM